MKKLEKKEMKTVVGGTAWRYHWQCNTQYGGLVDVCYATDPTFDCQYTSCVQISYCRQGPDICVQSYLG